MTRGVALIAGGGIGGLSAALAIAAQGWRCIVLERRPASSEAGAGIQIGPNGVRILERLGVAKRLAPHVGTPKSIQLRDGLSGASLSSLPLGAWIAARHGAAYWTAHRADLHAALVATVAEQPGVEIWPGFDVTRIDDRASGVTVHGSNGQAAGGDILIGADGYASTVRRLTFGAFDLSPTGRVAARTVLPVAKVPAAIAADSIGAWLAPGMHVVHYPVRGGQEIALVVVTQGDARTDGWGTALKPESVHAKAALLAEPVRALVSAAASWRQWSLVTSPPLASWFRGRTVLAGDATQPLMPFLAQGAVMAMEDAVVLADCLAQSSTHVDAFAVYERTRRSRRKRVQSSADRNGRIYHLSGLPAAARNMTLRALPGPTLMTGYDWLYGFQA